MSKQVKKLDTALKELEQIVDDLSSTDIDVEEGLKKFRQGAELIKFCRSQLKRVENEFYKIKEGLETDTNEGE